MFSVVDLAPVILFTVSQGGLRKSAGTDNILFTTVSERSPSTVVQYYPWRYCMCAARARARSTSFPGSEWDVNRRDPGNEVGVLCPDFCSSTDKKLCTDKWPCPRTRARALSLNDAESNQHLHALSCLKIVLPINNKLKCLPFSQ